jgi:dihydrofolate reductase
MKLIIACDPNGGIGYENKLPWSKIEGDLPRFKALTTGKVVFMGRNTWESLPIKPLSHRINIVITSKVIDGVRTMPRITVRDNIFYKDSWIIGGAKLIGTHWWCIDEVYLTKTFTEYTCDTFIDLLYLEKLFTLVSEENFSDHVYQIWKRK